MAMLYQDDPNLERRRQLAQAMMARGQQQGPVQHWTQGADRIANSLLGAYQNKKVNEEADLKREKAMTELSAVLSGNPGVQELNKPGGMVSDMGQPQGSEEEQLVEVLSGINPEAALQLRLNQMQQRNAPASTPYGKINPGDHTPESLAVFEKTGRISDLRPRQSSSGDFAKIDSSLYTPESIARFEQTGSRGDLVFRDEGPSAEGPGQTAVDKAFAKEYAEWTAGGGFADTRKQIGQLQEARQALESGSNLTGPFVGRTPDWVRSVVNPKSIETREAVEEVVQRNLREVLGAQFTEKEGERLISRAYNDNLSEEENTKRVGRLIDQILVGAEQKANAMQYFEENGTLTGWEGKLPTMSDFTSINFDGGTNDTSIDDLVNQYAD